jgi:GT2 family glycosyltransferase
VNWNTKELLKDCLNSIYREDMEIGNELIIVDNNSTDGSQEMVSAEFPMARLIKNNSNEGFARANNRGLREVQGRYVLLLNSDTIIPDTGIFGKWISFMDGHPEAGASGCKLIKADGSHCVGDAGYKPSVGSILSYAFFLSKIFASSFHGIFLNYHVSAEATAVDWISGAAFMVRRSILVKVGLLDENVFMYAEDVEWGCRIKANGHKIFYLPELVIIHLVGGSSRKNNGHAYSNLWLENLRRLYAKFNPDQPIFIFDLIFAAGLLMRAFLYLAGYVVLRRDSLSQKSREMMGYFSFLMKLK